jgi:hypothetical protein
MREPFLEVGVMYQYPPPLLPHNPKRTFLDTAIRVVGHTIRGLQILTWLLTCLLLILALIVGILIPLLTRLAWRDFAVAG